MKRVSLKGVAIGNITDFLSTIIVLFPLAIYILVTSGFAVDNAAHSVDNILRASNFFFVSSWTLGGLGSTLGGYVAARIAKHDELLNGGLSSVLSVANAVYALASGGAADNLLGYFACLPFSVALGTLGGFLRVRQSS